MTGNNDGSVIVVRQKDLRTDRRGAQRSVLALYPKSKSTRLMKQVIAGAGASNTRRTAGVLLRLSLFQRERIRGC